MLALVLTTVLLCSSQSATGNSCTKTGNNDFTIQVDVTENGLTTAYLSMKNISSECPRLCFFQYNATERPIKCSRERGMKFACRRLEQFSSLVSINDDEQKNYSVYTDTQEITAVMETTNATVTCHFANGTLCKRCTVKLSRNNFPSEEITLFGDRDSLTETGTGTVTGLIPRCSYSLIGKSVGARTPIEVEGELVTKEAEPDESQSNPSFTAVWATVVAVLVCAMCAILLLSHLVMMKRRKRGAVSVKRVSSFRAKVKAQTESKELHIRKTEDNYLEVGPPLPPRTLDMFIPVADDDTSTSTDSASTRSTAVTIEDTDSTTATLTQHQTLSPTLDTISICSEAPPIPPRTAALLQDDKTDSDVKSTPENTSSSSPKLPPTLRHPLASNQLHAWQVSIHDPKSHKWFVFPRMLRQSRVNADSIPMHPNLSYETFATNGCATY